MGSHHNINLSLATSGSDCQVLLATQANVVSRVKYDFVKCLSCTGGRSCLKCVSGAYDDARRCYSIGGRHCLSCLRVACPFFDETAFPRARARAVLVPLSVASSRISHNRKKVRNRFFMRCVLGIEIALAAGFRVRAFTLSESDYALGMDLAFGRAANKFFVKMNYDYGKPVPRYVITHQAVGSARLDRHVICFGTGRLDVLELDRHWHKVYGSKVTGMEEIWSARGLAFYLARYLGGNEEKFVKASMSPHWVFPKWWQFNLAFHRAYGEYPSLDLFVKLLRLPEDYRAHEVDDYLKIWSMK